MKRKLLLAALCVVSALGMRAQTDVTSQYLTNPSFEYKAAENAATAEALSSGGTYYGWNLPSLGSSYVNISIGNNTTCNGQAFGISNAKDGSFYYFNRRGWNSSSSADGTLSTTMPSMLVGHYTVTVWYKGYEKYNSSSGTAAHKTNGSYLKITAVESETTLGTKLTSNFDKIDNKDNASYFSGNNNWKSESLTFDVTTSGDVTLNIIEHLVGGVRADVIIDNITLTYEPFATSEDYTNLNAAISTVEGKAWGFDVDEYAPYNYVELLETLATAKAINQSANNSQVTVQTLTATLNGATWTANTEEVNAIWDPSFQHEYSTSGNVQPIAWTGTSGHNNATDVRWMWDAASNDGLNATTSGKALFTKFGASYGETAGYTLPLNSGAYYTIGFKYGGWNDCKKNGFVIVTDPEATELTMKPSKDLPLDYTDGNTDKTHWKNYQAIFKTNDAGNYILGLRHSGGGIQSQYVYGDFVLKATTVAEAQAYYEYVLDEVDDSYDAGANGGTEKTAFKAAIDADVSGYSTVAQFMDAAENLYAKRDAFLAATPIYDALVAEIAHAKTLGIANATADSYAATSESTAATALASTQELKVAEYTHITATYTESATLSTWTEDFDEDLNGEGYYADGIKYFNEWGTNTRTAKQNVTLPAGDYAVRCIGRGDTGTSGYLYYKIGDADAVTTNFNMKGNRGRGVDTSGAANFSDGGTYTCSNEGFGWEYRFLTFTLDAEAEVEIGVSGTFSSSWVSFYAPQLFTTEASVKNVRLTQIAAALETVPTGNMNATVKSTLDTKVAAAEAATASNTKDELATILEELNAAITTANTSKTEYTKIQDYLDDAISKFGDEDDYTAVQTAIDGGDYTDSSDGMAAVKARRVVVATTGMAADADLTGLIDNNSFELGNTNFWTTTASDDTGVRSTASDTYAMSNSDGNYLFNTWWQGTPITQNIGTLPAGAYELKGVVASDGGTIYITMNDKHEACVETADAKAVGIEFAYIFTLDEAQEVTVGIVGGADGTKGAHKDYSASGYWFYKVDNFRLKYLGATAPENTLDGTYYFATSGSKISRGGDSETEAVMATEGLPIQITTDKAGISTLKMRDTEKYLMWNKSMVYTDGVIDPAKTNHQPYWKIIPTTGGYNILNTESGLYLTTAVVERDGVTLVASCTSTPAVWTLTDAELDGAKAELALTIANAPATPTINVGTGVFQIPQAQVDALKNAKTNGQDVYDNNEATLSEVQDAIDAFDGIDITTLNAPAEGQLFNIKNVTDGYVNKDKLLTFKATKDADLEANTTSMGWTESVSSIYPQAVKFTAVEGTNNYKLSYTRADGNEVYAGTGSSTGLGTNDSQIRPTTDASKAATFRVDVQSTEGVWKLYNVAASNYVGAANDAGFYTNGGSNSEVNISEAANASVELNVLETNKYGTLILPFTCDIPDEGVTVYSCAATVGNELTLVEVKTGKFAANTPYIVYAPEGKSATLQGLGAAYTDASYTEGLLTGVYTATTALVDSYVLQKNDKVAFYQVGEEVKPTVGAYRCYLTAPAAEAKAFFFPGDDEATVIEGLDALTAGEYEAIYTMGGVKVNALQKGTNIVQLKSGKTLKINVK